MSVAGDLAVLLMDYGAPRSDAEVRPFIASVLTDPAVLPLPPGLRHAVGHGIAALRAGKVAARYRAVGGSPLPAALAGLAEALAERLPPGTRVLPACSHAEPSIRAVVRGLPAAGVRRALGLPLFPQRSAATSEPCGRAFLAAAAAHGIEASVLPEFWDERGFLDAVRGAVRPLLGPGSHLLFVAHGLPERLERAGDPYPRQVRATASALAAGLPAGQAWSLAFQSRVGRGAWTGPYLDDEIERLAGTGVTDLVLAPISFCCENLETCWDLDREAAAWATALGIGRVARAPTPGSHPALLDAFARRIAAAAGDAAGSPHPGALP